jgi:hypothetical protein
VRAIRAQRAAGELECTLVIARGQRGRRRQRIVKIPQRIQRREPERVLGVLQCQLALAFECVQRALEEQRQRIVRIDAKRALVAVEGDVELLQQIGVDEAVDRQRQRALRVGVERPLGAIQRESGVQVGVV